MIRQLREDDLRAFVALRREALLDAPLSFAAAPGGDFASDPDELRAYLYRAPDDVLFGAFEGELVGTAGLFRDRHLKSRHKAHLWGMYVTPSARGRGLAARLLQAALQHARELGDVTWVHLSVSSSAPGAQRVYESAGFQTWGREPEARWHEGESVFEHHMALRVAPRA